MNKRKRPISSHKAAESLSTPTGVKPSSAEPKKPSRQDQLIAMLVSDGGATLPAMVEATRWQSHTVRAALSGLRKRHYTISSDKLDGVRTYRGVAPE